MALAPFRKVTNRNDSGRFVVSEGVAPWSYFKPHEALPTFWYDYEDDRFEVVIPIGTILSAVKDSTTGETKLVPCNGTGSTQEWGDTDTVTNATPTDVDGAGEETVTVPARSTPIGCAQYNLYRPFDKGTSQGAGWIRRALVEWPMVQGLNHTVVPGDYIRSDAFGRPVVHTPGTDDLGVVGKCIETETFALNYDDGLLSYMQLPSDPGALKSVYELTSSGPFQGKLGIRKNLDVTNAVGAMRVVINL